MEEMKKLTTPLTSADVETLKVGDKVSLTGVIYTGRDAAHKRLVELLDAGKELPFDPKGQIIYYVGPAPAKPGSPIGSAGPTTSYRMDAYAPRLIEVGLKGMIGKGSMLNLLQYTIQFMDLQAQQSKSYLDFSKGIAISLMEKETSAPRACQASNSC